MQVFVLYCSLLGSVLDIYQNAAISLQIFFSFFECLGAKLLSSISVCGETSLNSFYYTKISQQDLSSLALSYTGSGKEI